MGLITDIIKFNVTKRHRKERGQDRNFDTAGLASIINGAEVQEMVKNGDLVGYYGHWVRQKFGLNPVEGVVHEGRQVLIQPAIRTVYLKAYNNGDIEHKQEFLDTDSGKFCEKLYKSKTGGLSSTIKFDTIRGKQIARKFFGFDYVLEPNYTKNRGWEVACDSVLMPNFAFDSVGDSMIDIMDDDIDALADYFDSISMHNALLESKEAEINALREENKRILCALDSCETENAELYSMLSKDGNKPEIAMDGVIDVVRMVRSTKFDEAESFLDAELVGYAGQEPEGVISIKCPEVKTAFDRVLDGTLRR